MSTLNKVQLIGHLGADPEIRFTPNGTQVGNFSIATAEQWRDAAGNRQQRTQWHRVVVWQGLAEICGKFLAKGKKVYVEGRFQSREYTANDGSKRTAFEVVATEMKMLDRNPNQADPSTYAVEAAPVGQTNGAATQVAAPVAEAAPVGDAPMPEAELPPEAEAALATSEPPF